MKIVTVLLVLLAACADSGDPNIITCYSAGKEVLKTRSKGMVVAGDGYILWIDPATNKSVISSMDCVAVEQ